MHLEAVCSYLGSIQILFWSISLCCRPGIILFLGNSHLRDLFIETLSLADEPFLSRRGFWIENGKQKISRARRLHSDLNFDKRWTNISVEYDFQGNGSAQRRMAASVSKFSDVAIFLDQFLNGSSIFDVWIGNGVRGKRAESWIANSTLVFTAGFTELEFLFFDALETVERDMKTISDALDRTLLAFPDLKVVFVTIPPMGSQTPQSISRLNELMVFFLKRRHGDSVVVLDYFGPVAADFDNQWHDTHHVVHMCLAKSFFWRN